MAQKEMPQRAQSSDDLTCVSKLMSDFTVEITPGSAKKIDDFRAYLRPGTWVYVTALPGSDFGDVIDTCRILTQEGMTPVPHFVARGLTGKTELDEKLAKVTSEAGVRRVLAIAGATREPIGEFEDSMQMLETGLFDKYGIASIGVAGHPEWSPDMTHETQKEAGLWKNAFAERSDASMYLVTQFVFDAVPVIDWLARIKAGGNQLPVVVGIPGLATLKSLIGHAVACGVGPSMTMLKKKATKIHKLMSLTAPDQLVLDLAKHAVTHPDCSIAGVHIYPFGGLERSARWANAVAQGDFAARPNGFTVNLQID